MFIGEYQHSMDSKNRIIIPSKVRDELGNPFVMTKGLDGCIYCYPMSEWDVMNEKLKKLPDNRKDIRKYIRYFTAGASFCEIDKQGRALVPQNLVSYGNFVNDVVVVGVQNKLEIWSKDKWDEYQDEDFDIDAIAETISSLDL